ncbi:MAG: zinc ribbon domain-containing protein [Phenylobacterium sp.]|nr:zinc ribbon domain-containing protein [Phenylobacterium sp.]
MPPEQWKRTPVEHLRIIDDPTWRAVRDRKARASAQPHAVQRRPSLFGGLLRCGSCGGAYVTYTTGKLVCVNYRERGTCTNRRTPARAKVEAVALEVLREQMLAPQAVASYVRAYRHAAAARKAAAADLRAPLARRIAEAERGLARLVSAIERGVSTPAMEARVADLETERKAAQTELDALTAPEPTIELHPDAPRIYAEMVAQLQATLAEFTPNNTQAERALADSVRGLVDRIVIIPRSQERGGPIDIEVEGTLARLSRGGAEPNENRGLGVVVAGGGLEPPTCGL